MVGDLCFLEKEMALVNEMKPMYASAVISYQNKQKRAPTVPSPVLAHYCKDLWCEPGHLANGAKP